MFDKWMSRRSFLTISAMTAMFLTLDRKRLAALNEKINPKKNYPVVIIGAGLGGLCTAGYLVKERNHLVVGRGTNILSRFHFMAQRLIIHRQQRFSRSLEFLET